MQLLPFLITRQLLCGAGMIKKGRFVLSQRADQVWEGVSSATTRTRPIINTRDEPHADSAKYRRLHVIVGDSNMSEVTTALKVGSTLLVLEMIEAGVALPDFEMANEIRSIREIARDFTGQVDIALRSGSTATPLEVQRAFYDAACAYLAHREDVELGTPNAELAPVVDLWGRVLDCFDTGDFAPVSTEIDWVIKKSLLDRMAAARGLDPIDPRLAQIDLMYHDIHPTRGLFHVLARRGLARTLLETEEIEQAVRQAPQTTRAAVRGRFISAVRAHPELSYTVDWMRVKVNGENGAESLLADPFATTDEDVDRIIASMEAR